MWFLTLQLVLSLVLNFELKWSRFLFSENSSHLLFDSIPAFLNWIIIIVSRHYTNNTLPLTDSYNNIIYTSTCFKSHSYFYWFAILLLSEARPQISVRLDCMKMYKPQFHGLDKSEMNTPEFLAWRRLHLSKSKLSNCTEMAEIMSAFAVVSVNN
jgi:hypothetical protein